MRHFQTEVTRRINRYSGRSNHVFGGRYKWSVLWNSFAYAYAYKYVARNPVRAGLVPRVEDYPYSHIRTLTCGERTVPLTEACDYLRHQTPKDLSSRLKWLNSPTPKELEELVFLALRRYEFSFSKGNDQRKRIETLWRSYGILPLSSSFGSAER